MESSVRTSYGAQLQTALLLGVPVVLQTSSTLNEKFDIQANTHISSTDKPAMRYIAAGNGGHKIVTGSDGSIGLFASKQHKPTDAALFNHLPWVLRALNNDLTAGQRANYGLRRLETHDGLQYAAYYLRRLDYTNVAPTTEYKTVTDGETTTTSFIPNSGNLNPTAEALASTGTNTTSGDYVATTAKVTFTLSEDDATELLAAAKIIHGSEDYAIISEMALVSGVDRAVTVTGSAGATFNFNEVIGAQVVMFMSEMIVMKFNNTGATIVLDVGATEPMFVLSSST